MGNRYESRDTRCYGMRLEWIDEQLREHGKTRKELADAIGLTESQMSKTMNGSRVLPASEADSIRRYFGFRLPDDPAVSDLDRIYAYISRLDGEQARVVALYLSALAGEPEALHRAS